MKNEIELVIYYSETSYIFTDENTKRLCSYLS